MCYLRGGGRVGELRGAGKLGARRPDDKERAAAEGLLRPEEDTEEDDRPLKMQARDAGSRDRPGGAGLGVMDALRELEGGRRGAEDEWGDTPSGVQVKSDGTVRYCRKVRSALALYPASPSLTSLGEQCATFKPDRAHHCSSCGYCVLKMDQ